jgi:hypothetical protein
VLVAGIHTRTTHRHSAEEPRKALSETSLNPSYLYLRHHFRRHRNCESDRYASSRYSRGELPA